ncbi:MAG: hypothetical protein ABI167_11050 [Nitrosospira sp.]
MSAIPYREDSEHKLPEDLLREAARFRLESGSQEVGDIADPFANANELPVKKRRPG